MSSSTPAGGQTPPADETTPAQTRATSGQTPATPLPSDDDEPMTRAEAKRLREELKTRRETEKAALAERDELKKSLMTAEERKEARLQELEAKHSTFEQKEQEWRVERAILLESPGVGLKPALAMKLIDWTAVKTDKHGEPTNIPELLAQVYVDYPELKRDEQPPSTSQRPPAPRVPSTNPPASSVGVPVNETVADLKKYTLSDAYKRTRQ